MSHASHRPDWLASLLDPAAYSWRPEAVELIETHISWVLLAGDRVVKLKRPVDLGFVDHRTLAARKHACEEEIRLNRRLTDDVYLSVEPIARTASGARVGGDGEPIEWATVMRRLPADRMLDRLIAANDPAAAPGRIGSLLAGRLAPFHLGVAAPCGSAPSEEAAAQTRIVRENVDALDAFRVLLLPGRQLDLVQAALRDALDRLQPLLHQRAAASWIRDGHGDLRCEHICIESDGRVQIYDCVEFSPAIRCADVASDLAFLLTDLRRLGRASDADDLVAACRAAGLDLPDALLALYATHRALVRVKVDGFTDASTDPARHREIARDAADWLDLATGSALRTAPALMAMTGLSGSGKSHIAGRIATITNAVWLQSDAIRKELAGVTGSAVSEWGEGIYTPAWGERVYAEMLARAEAHLATGRPVVVDAAFLARAQRDAAAATARAAGVPLLIVETTCADAIARARLVARAAGNPISDADASIRDRQAAQLAADPPGLPAGARLIQIETSSNLPASLDDLLATLSAAGVLMAGIV